ncbi:peptidyl-prolyl cis-trans isomerase [Solibacillus sp. FSL H8-0538]|uniref:peptidyl-prolyl cis-trans isomerase n=1 Tax=Solibacillus sp. FSL H8-0538 TaxID=2921400 RepID=UPI0030FB72FA
MRSTQNNKLTQTSPNTPISQKRLKTKPTLILLLILLIGNLFWFVLWLLPSGEQVKGGDEQVAAVDGQTITRQEWLAAMESRYGKETLQNLVNEAVMEKAANQYKIKVTDEEIDLELALLRSAQDSNDTTIQNLSDSELRQKIRAQLILEKVLTKDVVTEDTQSEAYYEENKSLYNIPTTYRTSIIVVESKDDAISVKKELANGSEFSVLARERSLDTSSASLGGDIGYVTATQTSVDPAIFKAVQSIKVNDTTEPFVLSDGRYALAFVEEILEGQSFSYDNVKDRIKRELAMEQLPSSITPEAFWAEFNATWYYGEGK